MKQRKLPSCEQCNKKFEWDQLVDWKGLEGFHPGAFFCSENCKDLFLDENFTHLDKFLGIETSDAGTLSQSPKS